MCQQQQQQMFAASKTATVTQKIAPTTKGLMAAVKLTVIWALLN